MLVINKEALLNSRTSPSEVIAACDAAVAAGTGPLKIAWNQFFDLIQQLEM